MPPTASLSMAPFAALLEQQPGPAALWRAGRFEHATGVLAGLHPHPGPEELLMLASRLLRHAPDAAGTLAEFLARPAEGELMLGSETGPQLSFSWCELGDGWLLFKAQPGHHVTSGLRHRFMARVIHDLKSPLATIRGYAELLQRQANLEPRHQAYLSHIIEEAEREVQLIESLRDRAAAATGQLRITLAPIDLAPLLERAAERFRARHAQTPLVVCSPFEALPAQADAERLLDALDNLLDNAQAYGTPGASIQLHAARHKGEIVLTIEDQGPGISPAALRRLFEPFYRAPGAPSGGMGLGLSIAEAIARAHGGRMWAESTPGKGSRFNFALPGEAAR